MIGTDTTQSDDLCLVRDGAGGRITRCVPDRPSGCAANLDGQQTSATPKVAPPRRVYDEPGVRGDLAAPVAPQMPHRQRRRVAHLEDEFATVVRNSTHRSARALRCRTAPPWPPSDGTQRYQATHVRHAERRNGGTGGTFRRLRTGRSGRGGAVPLDCSANQAERSRPFREQPRRHCAAPNGTGGLFRFVCSASAFWWERNKTGVAATGNAGPTAATWHYP